MHEVWTGVDAGSDREGPEDQGEIRRAVLKLVRDDPEVIEQLERSERLMDVLASRPEIEEEIVAMAEEVGGG